jgi:hypothetical protein
MEMENPQFVDDFPNYKHHFVGIFQPATFDYQMVTAQPWNLEFLFKHILDFNRDYIAYNHH